MLTLARFISALFNPFFLMLPVPFLIVYRQTRDAARAFHWEFFSITFMAVVALFVLYGVRRGFFTDFNISKRPQRKTLYIFASFITILYFISVLLFRGPNVLLVAVSGIILGILLLSVINTRIKASIHVATVSAFLVSLALLYGGIFVFGILLIPIIAWARIVTRNHTISEAFVGGIVGGGLILLLFSVLQYLSRL